MLCLVRNMVILTEGFMDGVYLSQNMLIATTCFIIVFYLSQRTEERLRLFKISGERKMAIPEMSLLYQKETDQPVPSREHPRYQIRTCPKQSSMVQPGTYQSIKCAQLSCNLA